MDLNKFTKTKQNKESKDRFKHFMYVPWTGLGLYNGFRGNAWLKNRIKIFKQFVIPSLQAQSAKDFTVWCSWRPEERRNPHVRELMEYMKGTGLDTIHTFSGVCFWDDKYEEKEARDRLLMALHGAMTELVDATTGEFGYEWVYMTIQPSDDCYHKNAVQVIHKVFQETPHQAVGFEKGYMMNYVTKELAEYNPTTNPPFYTIKFPRPVFIDPLQHANYTALKHDVGQYKKGTPIPSHEYVKDALSYGIIRERGFLVGCHGENISTVFNHPFRGATVDQGFLRDFGLQDVSPLRLDFSFRREVFKRLPYKVQRKLRYWAGEKRWLLRPLFSLIYNGLRS